MLCRVLLPGSFPVRDALRSMVIVAAVAMDGPDMPALMLPSVDLNTCSGCRAVGGEPAIGLLVRASDW